MRSGPVLVFDTIREEYRIAPGVHEEDTPWLDELAANGLLTVIA
jgi:hypothetical protein